MPSGSLADIRLALITHAACLAFPILAVMVMALACARTIYRNAVRIKVGPCDFR
ncbi:hypothetical protein [Acidiferrobacter sp.]|uniref:hypothetical protein n=1 Tax=Acidiferrobacter sp. TaxID=1872107 RepID=UPI00260F710B|nr:hypothetical protein [Acidiferrobacter sp.]